MEREQGAGRSAAPRCQIGPLVFPKDFFMLYFFVQAEHMGN